MDKFLWLLNGINGRFVGGVFENKADADLWILSNNLTGVLTKYPLNKGVYQWAIEKGLFTPKKEEHKSAEFIGKFSTASQEHYPYENGREE